MRKILCHKYELISPIAEGGMGSIYLVKDLHSNQPAVVKIQEKKDICCAEIRILERLFHPALPKVIDYFEEKEKTYIVMEYIEGITLEQYLYTVGRVEWKQAVRWGIELAEVITYLHSLKPCIIYRDLKPSNIMIDSDGRIRLIDFGAACAWERRKEAGLAGTLGYGAPEQWKWGGVCKESDIYALGIVLCEMLTGRKTLCDRKENVRSYDREIPKELQRIVAKCTKMRIVQRYRTARKVQCKLEKVYRKAAWKKKVWPLKFGICMFLCGIWLLSPMETIRETMATEMQKLKVEMRDERYRKLLIKDDYLYQPQDALRFEIAKENLPAGKMSLQIVVIDEEETVYESRVFLVENN